MKKNLLYILMLSLLFVSCEDNRLDGLEPDKIYLPKAGKFVEVSYTIGSDAVAELWTYKSSLNGTSCVVEYTMKQSVLDEYNAANGTNYLLLPEDCYTIPNNKIAINGDAQHAKFNVKYSPEKIVALCGGIYEMEKYALPFEINSAEVPTTDLKSAVLVFKVKEPVVKMLTKKTANVDFSAGLTGSVTQNIEFGMAFNSIWDCKFEIETDNASMQAILDTYNRENNAIYQLLPTTAYTLTPTEGKVTIGSNKGTLMATIDKAKVLGGNYAIVVALKSIDLPLKVSPTESYTIVPVICLDNFLSKAGWSVTVSSNNPNYGTAAGLIDGNLNTYWHPAGRKFSEAIPQDVQPWAVVDMKKECNVSCFEIDPRQDQFYPTKYNTLRCYVSNDGVNFTEVGSVAKPWPTTVNNTKDKCIVPVKVTKGRYVKISFDYDLTNAAIAFGELSIRGAEASN